MQPIPLDALLSYARCSLAWFWEYRAQAPVPNTPVALAASALRSGLDLYYGGHGADLVEAVLIVWNQWVRAWDVDDAVLDALMRYAHGRDEILAEFAAGRITRPGGKPYIAPQMSRKYRERMHAAGLLAVGKQLDAAARQLGLVLPGDDKQAGSPFGDAFADGLAAAQRAGSGSSKLPGREVVLGTGVPYVVDTGNGMWISATADLVLQAPDGRGAGAVVIEVHDFRRTPPVWAGQAARTCRVATARGDLRVIAAMLARHAGGAAQPVTWESVAQVVYRHFHSGESHTIRQMAPGRLVAVVAAAARGMRSQVVVPRLLTSADECRGCPFRERCFMPYGWDCLDRHNPTVFVQAEQILTTVREVQAEIGADSDAGRRARAALEHVHAALQAQAPDAQAMETLIAETAFALREVD